MSQLLGGRYALGEMIGTGGMADVFIGDDTRLNRKVAIKVLRRDLSRDPSFVARFRKEALAAGGLNHSGIVSVYDSGEENNSPYIVMELITETKAKGAPDNITIVWAGVSESTDTDKVIKCGAAK